MARTGVIAVSMSELNRLKVVQAVVDGFLKPGLAAERVGLTDRQFRRLVARYRAEGPSGLNPGSVGSPAIVSSDPMSPIRH